MNDNKYNEMQEGQAAVQEYFDRISNGQEEIKENVRYLQDLFVRRLNEDKQKAEMIKHLEALSTFSIIEPFLSDMILILDRIDGNADDFTRSVGEELYDALNRRGLIRIEAYGKFNPAQHKAIRIVDDDAVDEFTIVQVVRNGYSFGNKVIRPAEVVVSKPSQA